MRDVQAEMEAYFKRELSDAEMQQFEQRCVHDEAFARAVALYISTEEGIRQHLLDEKRKEWKAVIKEERDRVAAPVRKLVVRKWIAYAAAACVLVAVALIFSSRSDSPHRLANEYVAQHFTYLSHTMSAASDTLQQGLTAYNNKQYDSALLLFEKVYQANPANSKAKRNIGLVYLATKQYDKALQQFEALANMPGLYENPGLFLMAVTLLERNSTGDGARAKAILQQVVQQRLEGSKEAQQWLTKWK